MSWTQRVCGVFFGILVPVMQIATAIFYSLINRTTNRTVRDLQNHVHNLNARVMLLEEVMRVVMVVTGGTSKPFDEARKVIMEKVPGLDVEIEEARKDRKAAEALLKPKLVKNEPEEPLPN